MRAWRRTPRACCLSLEIYRFQVYSWPLPPPQHLRRNAVSSPMQAIPHPAVFLVVFGQICHQSLRGCQTQSANQDVHLIYHHRSGTSLAPSSSNVIRIVERWSLISLFLAPCFCFRDSYCSLLKEGPELWIGYQQVHIVILSKRLSTKTYSLISVGLTSLSVERCFQSRKKEDEISCTPALGSSSQLVYGPAWFWRLNVKIVWEIWISFPWLLMEPRRIIHHLLREQLYTYET